MHIISFCIHLISAYCLWQGNLLQKNIVFSKQASFQVHYTVHMHRQEHVNALAYMYIMWKFWFLVHVNICIFFICLLLLYFENYYSMYIHVYLTKCDSPWVLPFHVAMTAFRGWNLLPVVRVWIVYHLSPIFFPLAFHLS